VSEQTISVSTNVLVEDYTFLMDAMKLEVDNWYIELGTSQSKKGIEHASDMAVKGQFEYLDIKRDYADILLKAQSARKTAGKAVLIALPINDIKKISELFYLDAGARPASSLTKVEQMRINFHDYFRDQVMEIKKWFGLFEQLGCVL